MSSLATDVTVYEESSSEV